VHAQLLLVNMAAVPPTAANTGDGSNSVQLANKLSQVNYKDLKFIIMDRPTVYNLPSYIRELKAAVRRVATPVRSHLLQRGRGGGL